jgi:hypothetical protein
MKAGFSIFDFGFAIDAAYRDPASSACIRSCKIDNQKSKIKNHP